MRIDTLPAFSALPKYLAGYWEKYKLSIVTRTILYDVGNRKTATTKKLVGGVGVGA